MKSRETRKKLGYLGSVSMLRISTILLAVAVLLNADTSSSFFQADRQMKNLSLEDLILKFQSTDSMDAYAAVKEMFERGEAVLPAIIGLKGNRKPFFGAEWLGRPSGQLVLSGGNEPPGTSVSVEVAALFVINAIYEKNLAFAQSPFLTDTSLPPEYRRARNFQSLVDRAWEAVETWLAEARSVGIEQMRTQKKAPFSGAAVDFW